MPEIRFNDDYHRKLRAKVARHRARHKARRAVEAEAKRLARGRQRPGPQQRWRLYERTEPRGETADVVLVRDGPAPSGYAAGGWLPCGLLPYALAMRIAAMRRRQIREWMST